MELIDYNRVPGFTLGDLDRAEAAYAFALTTGCHDVAMRAFRYRERVRRWIRRNRPSLLVRREITELSVKLHKASGSERWRLQRRYEKLCKLYKLPEVISA